MWLIVLFFIILVVDMVLIRKRNKHLKEAAKMTALTHYILSNWIKEHPNYLGGSDD